MLTDTLRIAGEEKLKVELLPRGTTWMTKPVWRACEDWRPHRRL